MSRSRRAPFTVGRINNGKREANRKVRRQNKKACNKHDLADTPVNNSGYKRYYSSWDIIDYVFYSPDIKKASRK